MQEQVDFACISIMGGEPKVILSKIRSRNELVRGRCVDVLYICWYPYVMVYKYIRSTNTYIHFIHTLNRSAHTNTADYSMDINCELPYLME